MKRMKFREVTVDIVFLVGLGIFTYGVWQYDYRIALVIDGIIVMGICYAFGKPPEKVKG